MKFGRLVRCVRAWLLLGVVGAACGESTATISSETNWFRTCKSSDDCREGSCRCGVCTTTCEDDATCQRVGDGVCALMDSPGYAAQCGAEALDEGVCLQGCDSESACGAGRTCTDGVCVDADKSGSGGSSSTTGTTEGGAGSGGEPCPRNSRAECAVDCAQSSSDCGTETSNFDASGCARVVCRTDADCESDERCFGLGTGEPELCISMFTCTQEESDCVCGGGGECYPGYCVPR